MEPEKEKTINRMKNLKNSIDFNICHQKINSTLINMNNKRDGL
jgi:hypothetical protein